MFECSLKGFRFQVSGIMSGTVKNSVAVAPGKCLMFQVSGFTFHVAVTRNSKQLNDNRMTTE